MCWLPIASDRQNSQALIILMHIPTLSPASTCNTSPYENPTQYTEQDELLATIQFVLSGYAVLWAH